MKFELLGWKCEGLRCPDFNFEIDKSGNATATFLQMPNGTGKTTTLRLLKRSLYNHQFKSTEMDQYKAKLKKEYKDKGFFQAKYKIEGNIFYTQINFEFDKNNSYYTSSLTEKG
jgi:DNA sulfur modification protein DndD